MNDLVDLLDVLPLLLLAPVLCVICCLKGKLFTGLVGIAAFVLLPYWLVVLIVLGVLASRLAYPGSWWARRFYGPEQMARARERFGSRSAGTGFWVNGGEERVVRAERIVAAPAATLFDLIAEPAQQPRWDGNRNVGAASAGQRIRGVGDIFVVTLTRGAVRENHVVAFEEGRHVAWRPAEPGQRPPGHLWRWELEAVDDAHTRVRHTYDWTELTDEERVPRARATTTERLQASIDRLAALAGERSG